MNSVAFIVYSAFALALRTAPVPGFHSLAPLRRCSVPAEYSSTPVSSIGTGYLHTCAAQLENGLVICWGSNDDGQASGPSQFAFTAISGGGGRWHTSITSNGHTSFTCGISEGGLRCFGSNQYGQISSAPNSTIFLAIATGSAFEFMYFDIFGPFLLVIVYRLSCVFAHPMWVVVYRLASSRCRRLRAARGQPRMVLLGMLHKSSTSSSHS